MRALARIGLGMLVAMASVLAFADELPPFEGQTIADAVLKRDALSVIALIIHSKLDCTVIDRVESEPVLRHPHVALPEAAGRATYERWTVSACSKKQPFSMIFYPAKGGGMMFQVKPEKVSDS
jgi:hypothetical protein